jgi:predicted acyltransferase
MLMTIVNNPGDWGNVYPPLLHAEWHGFTLTDLVFPTFLFVVGNAMSFSQAKYEAQGQFLKKVFTSIEKVRPLQKKEKEELSREI